MFRIDRLALFVLSFLSSGIACSAPLDARALEALVKRTRAFWHVPGVAVAIVRGDEVTFICDGVRSLADRQPITPDTLFPIASCTKSFTTAAMALLVDEGKLNWDDPPQKYVSYFHLSDPLADREVTLRDLVTHRTGLRGHNMLWHRSPWTPEEIIRRVGRLPLDKPFRAEFQYQSTMFTVAGFAVACAADMPWRDFVRKRFLEPLGMKATHFTTTAISSTADKASPHGLAGDGKPQSVELYPMETPDPAGSMQSNVRDLSQWLRFHLHRGSVNGKSLVSARQLRVTHTPQMALRIDAIDRIQFPETHQMSYGMGWVVMDHFGHLLLQHAGAIDGFRCHFTLVPQKNLGIVLLCNLHETRMNIALSNSLLELLLKLPHRNWNTIVAEAERTDERMSAEREREHEKRRHHGTHTSRELAAYTDTYEHPAYGSVRVSLANGSLHWKWNRFDADLTHYHYDTFRLPFAVMGRPRVVFTLDAKGTVARMRVLGNMDVEFVRKR